MIGLGKLVSITYHDDAGRGRTLRPRGRWLGWTGGRRGDLRIVRRVGVSKAKPSKAAVAAHRRFHRFAPSSVVEVEWNPKRRGARLLGLVTDIYYSVPRSIRSRKAGVEWRHAAGDFGAGDARNSDRWRPALYRDRGELFIVRRPGNTYRVDTWIRG